ncbi:hypothetical protein SLEP1_g45161 [Rubroshorea leprosula]|uniref:Protein kinase domain-containing protein n=1 Tax=Rubroshorea leprosula TaxID=152421 RepID=A0AAV5LIX2_9ROSI|nr:hypothetical protein SLEP1_g45161 [Rubroshorea leprosula]
MMMGERLSSRRKDFSCFGSVSGSHRDLSSSGCRNYRKDFFRNETKRHFDSRAREISGRRGFCSESKRARFDGGVMPERGSDHEFKRARVSQVDEKLLPLKKRMGFRSSNFPSVAAESTKKKLDIEFDLMGLPKIERLPLLVLPQVSEVEEGEIVEDSSKLPPLVVLEEREIVKELSKLPPSVVLEGGEIVKSEALIQKNKPISENKVMVSNDQKPKAAIPRRSRDPLRSCRSLSEYELVSKINEGAYGVVYKAIEKKTGQVMALKRMKHRKGERGLPPAALREIEILFSIRHPSVLDVKEVVKGEADDFFMAMEFMDQDLHQFINPRKQGLSTAEVKGLMLQLLEGVSYLHRNKILHRDLKTSNLLLNKEGKLKICDFGLSCRERNDGKPQTSWVVTLWYRAPELLLGTEHYSKEIDMWSVGCIMAELLKKEPLFKGKSELDQLNSMVSVLGTPTVKNWPGLSNLPGVSNVNFAKQPENKLRQKFPVLSNLGVDLLQKLLTYDPKRRITAKSALSHGWFREFPLPKHLHI